jgi:hypothetical protein
MAPSTEDAFADKLSHLGTVEEKMATVISYLDQHDSEPSLGLLLPGCSNPPNPVDIDDIDISDKLHQLIREHGLESMYESHLMDSQATFISGMVIEKAPCANVQVARRWSCPSEGKSACSNCKLVRYCSKVGGIIPDPVDGTDSVTRPAKPNTGAFTR